MMKQLEQVAHPVWGPAIDGMSSANTSCPEENFSCSICLDVFNRPVTTPCGHNFCRACITTFWDDKVQYKCPICNELFHTKPDLRVNTLLSEMVDQFRRSLRVKEQPCVAPGEVPCDFCTGTQLKAVKSCLVCYTSYCQTHLEPHQRIAHLRKHLLVEPMDRLEDRMCKKHDRLLELFCQTEQVCLCQICTTDHKTHPVVPLKEEYEVKTAQLRKIESEVQQMIHERKQKVKEIKHRVKLSKADADREIADGVKVLTALMSCIQKQRDDFNQTVQEKLKSTEKQAEGLIKELEQEIKDLTNRSLEVKELTHTEDHLLFLQTFRSLKNPPHTRDWTTVEVCPPSDDGTLRRTLDQLQETLNMEIKKVPDLRSTLKKYACGLTLDQNTVRRRLSLSEDRRKVMEVKEDQSYPDHPERFDSQSQVLCREGLTGRCYWEVERRGGVDIGVTYRGITRRGWGYDSRLGWNNKSWSLYDRYSVRYNTFRSLKNPPHTRDWTKVEVCPPSDDGTLRRTLDQPQETLNMEKVPDLRSTLLQHACGLTLDQNTDRRRLSLSEDHRKVMEVEEDQSYPDHPERFDSQSQVLCREGLTGRCYWEVERRGGVEIGVTYRGVTRRGWGYDSRLGWNNKSWSLYCYDDRYSVRYNTFKSLKNPPHTRDWTKVEVCPPSDDGTLRRTLDQPQETLNMEMVPDLRSTLLQYACGLTLDPNTASICLSLSEDHRKVTVVRKEQSYPDHPERFDHWPQVLCREGLTGRCYWEVERIGRVNIGVTYRQITRRGDGHDSLLGGNNKSWSLHCHDGGYSVRYNGSITVIRFPPPVSTRVGVYLDRPAGSLSFYRVSPGVGGSSDTLTHIHTFHTTFTQEDLLPGFGFLSGFLFGPGTSVSLCGL
ncbi:Tripartite motif-containing protein 47 [Merluccius polli]|uniref:Tripartite motif-containing protein 47 n=1 Tax=Merluccius polli TaxID=89951 RepID=A0AA47MWA0_MERPO|nr:Tripartite motif-containing protein 47 [Merluccius polli]